MIECVNWPVMIWRWQKLHLNPDGPDGQVSEMMINPVYTMSVSDSGYRISDAVSQASPNEMFPTGMQISAVQMCPPGEVFFVVGDVYSVWQRFQGIR